MVTGSRPRRRPDEAGILHAPSIAQTLREPER
jgi:hypothetical protein